MKRLSHISVVAFAALLFAVAGSAQAGDGSVRPWMPGGFHRFQDFHFVSPMAVVPDSPEFIDPNF